MSIINEAIEGVMDMIDALELFSTIKRGALGTKTGLCCELAPSSPEEVYMDKNQFIPLDLTINGKHANLETLSDALNTIHSALTRATQYPAGERWQIVDITNQTLPDIVDREQNNVWLMASALSVKFFWKGD